MTRLFSEIIILLLGILSLVIGAFIHDRVLLLDHNIDEALQNEEVPFRMITYQKTRVRSPIEDTSWAISLSDMNFVRAPSRVEFAPTLNQASPFAPQL